MGAEYEWNQLHGNTASGYASIRIPLCRRAPCLSNSCCDSLCRQMGDPVYRNRTVWTDTQIDRVFTPTDGLLIFVSQAGTGPGTQTDPMSFAIADAIIDPNANFFLLNDDGDIVGD